MIAPMSTKWWYYRTQKKIVASSESTETL